MIFPKAYSNSHVFLGNPVKNNASRFNPIKHDASWMSGNFDVVYSSCVFLPFVAKMNKQHVYSMALCKINLLNSIFGASLVP